MTLEDLKDPWRLAALFKQARLRGWVQKTEAEILAVFAAATHAARVANANTPGLFIWLIRERAWSHLSCFDEDRAREQLRCLHKHGHT